MRLATDRSLHFIPELEGFRRMSQIERIKEQCIDGNGFYRYCLKTEWPIFVSKSWSLKRAAYASRVFSLAFHCAMRREGVVLSIFVRRSSPKMAKMLVRILAAMSFRLLRHFARIWNWLDFIKIAWSILQKKPSMYLWQQLFRKQGKPCVLTDILDEVLRMFLQIFLQRLAILSQIWVKVRRN